MRTFKSRFTTDISQHQRAMSAFRSQTAAAVRSARNQLLALGAISLGGFGIKEVTSSVLKLSSDMQMTKVAFETMLGSAEKAKAVVGDLVKFADVTPFDTAEIIASGRALMACGVSTGDLTKRLELLGNIAAGAKMQIQDMVAIYAKMANKGKVQTEELNQMAERGIPIYRLLCDMLSVTQEELSSMAEKGTLSFALIQEALEKLGGAGGQYFGLIGKQAKTLSGLWSTLGGNIRLLATEFGELIIPELSEYLDSIIKKIDEMKKSGELQGIMKSVADSLIELMKSVVSLAKFLAQNQELLFSAGKIILYYTAFSKLNMIIGQTAPLLKNMAGVKLNFQSLRRLSPTLRGLTTGTKTLVRGLGGLQTALVSVAAGAAVAFAGWEIGKQLAKMMQLEKVLTRLFVQMDPNIKHENPYEKPKPPPNRTDLIENQKKQRELEEQIRQLEEQKKKITTAGKIELSPEAKARIASLELEKKKLDEAAEENSEAEKRREEIKARIGKIKAPPPSPDTVKAIKAEIAEIEKSADDHKRAQARLDSNRAEISRLKKNPEVPYAKNRIAELETESAELDKAVRNYNDRTARRDVLKTELRRMKSSGNGLSPSARRKLKGLEAESKALDAEIAENKKAAEKRKKIQDEIDKLKNPARNEKVDPKKAEADKETKATAVSEIDKKIAKNKEDLKKLQDSEYKYKSAISQARADKAYWGKQVAEDDQKRKPLLKEKMSLGNDEASKKREAEIDAKLSEINTDRAWKMKEYMKSKTAVEIGEKDLAKARKASAEAAVQNAQKIAASEALKAKQVKENQKRILEIENEANEQRKKLAKERQRLEDEKYRDRMSEKIEKWRENIKGYQKEIDAAEKKLGKLGLNVDEDILKTPEQIKQQKQDDILRTKIEAQNRGEKVTFTKAETDRINELQAAQKKAREAKKNKKKDEESIEDAEHGIAVTEQAAAKRERGDREKTIAQREKITESVKVQLAAMRDANKPLEDVLKRLEKILKTGLPNEVL